MDFLYSESVMAAIGMAITFCALWFLIIFLLYRLSRTALLSA